MSFFLLEEIIGLEEFLSSSTEIMNFENPKKIASKYYFIKIVKTERLSFQSMKDKNPSFLAESTYPDFCQVNYCTHVL